MGSDVTNHQPITFVEYLAHNRAQQSFFKSLNDQFKCCVNVEIVKQPFGDFLLQAGINLFSVLELGALCAETEAVKSMRFEYETITHTLKMVDTAQITRHNAAQFSERAYEPRVQNVLRIVVTLQPEVKRPSPTAFDFVTAPTGAVDETSVRVYEAMQRFWLQLAKPFDDEKRLDAFALRLCAFDIEVGYSAALKPGYVRHTPKSVPTFANGYCQCICFRTATLQGFVDSRGIQSHHYVFLPSSICKKNISLTHFELLKRLYAQRFVGRLYARMAPARVIQAVLVPRYRMYRVSGRTGHVGRLYELFVSPHRYYHWLQFKTF
jgi:hypothetical protein